MSEYVISEAARKAGMSSKMIRHYESLDLIPSPARGDNGYRYYGSEDIHRLRFIARARGLGFSLDQIRRLLDLWDDPSRSSAAVKSLAHEHLNDIEARIRELEAMRATLKHLVKHCHGDDRPSCPIIETLEGEFTESQGQEATSHD